MLGCMRRGLGGKISDSQEKESVPTAGPCALGPSIRTCSSPLPAAAAIFIVRERSLDERS